MAVRLFLDKHTLNRWPHPLGRRLKISATLSGLGAAAIVEDLDASPLGMSVTTMGMWANMDAISLISMGYLAALDLLESSVDNAVILTSHAPLTRGWGHGEIAEAEDIVVTVDGNPATIAGYDPVVGILVLDQAVDPNSVVSVAYHYTPDPTIPVTHLNSGSFLLNQWNKPTLMPFPYNTVLGPYTTPQPQVVEHRYMAFDYPYTSVLNDPTSMLLNEPRHKLTLPRFQRVNSQLSVFFEGSENPEDPWEWIGEQPAPPPVIEGGLFVIEDASTSQDVVTSRSAFWRRPTDLTFNHAAILNFRIQALQQGGRMMRIFTCLGFWKSGLLRRWDFFPVQVMRRMANLIRAYRERQLNVQAISTRLLCKGNHLYPTEILFLLPDYPT